MGSESSELAQVKVRYKDPDGHESRQLTTLVAGEVLEPSGDLVFSSAVAGFGMLLRDSEHARGLTLDRVVELAREGQGSDREGYRADFIRLVSSVRSMDLLAVAGDR